MNTPLTLIPRALTITEIAIPEKDILEIEERLLPGDWRKPEIPSSTRDFLTPLLQSRETMAIRVPSVLVEQEFNFILNPLYAGFDQAEIVSVTDFVFDIRIK